MKKIDTPVNLSYIITTRNRLPFLKITMQRLMDQLQTDEEIVVVDSGSTDGTHAYLQGLFRKGKIQQWVSEPDRNQAHGWNKAMLMARGSIIKKIIDDDVFCYAAIRQCKTYMLLNPKVDVVISNDLSSRLDDPETIEKHSRLSQFENWWAGKTKAFTFGDVHLLIRRSALPYIGLYDTSFTMIDWEYALRISYKQAEIAYYTGYNALSVSHPQRVSSAVDRAKLDAEGKLGAKLYEYAGDNKEISTWSKLKILVGKTISKTRKTAPIPGLDNSKSVQDIYELYYQYIDHLYSTDDQFINPDGK